MDAKPHLTMKSITLNVIGDVFHQYTKKDWTFADQEQIDSLRAEANDSYKNKYRPFLESPDEEEHFLTPTEEALLCEIVTQTGIRFGDDFRPAIWPSVRWTAFAYFKRFY
uniref:Uncharacterized protein n=1 Tax=Ditylenchus dipsaci TaxID=166011 RepID=A0A915DUY0_9BILA